ncbi:MAG: RsmE family RNA methyltransferase [Gammaproteobacteria bacterium]|nr:RsmE family RNA methyltransferase [Gammaproteobacteria bacterium]
MLDANQTIIVGSPTANTTWSDLDDKLDDVVVAIGPEGGWSPSELGIWQSLPNVQLIKFGPRILRAETCAMVGLTLLQSRFGDIK